MTDTVLDAQRGISEIQHQRFEAVWNTALDIAWRLGGISEIQRQRFEAVWNTALDIAWRLGGISEIQH